VRAQRADDGIKDLSHRPEDLRGGHAMFAAVERLEHDLAELYFKGSDRLAVVDDDDLWPRFAEQLPARVRHSFALWHKEPVGSDVGAEDLLRFAQTKIERGDRLLDDDGDDATAGLLARTLDLALVEGSLLGVPRFGVPRTVVVDGCEEAVASVVDALLQGILWDQLFDAFRCAREDPGTRCWTRELERHLEDTDELPLLSA
jgi:hypothetical protein